MKSGARGLSCETSKTSVSTLAFSLKKEATGVFSPKEKHDLMSVFKAPLWLLC